MYRFKRITSLMLSAVIMFSSFGVVSVANAAENGEDVKISIKPVPKIDLALAVGNATMNLSNFESDLKAKLAAKGVDTSQLEIQALETKNMTAEDTFDWQIYDHPNYVESHGVPTRANHIVISNKDITFYGYTVPAFKDFMFMPETSTEKKTFTFEVLEQYTDWHTLEGAGFLFNATIMNNKVSGYVVLFGQNDIGLFELKEVNLDNLRNGTYNSLAQAGAKIATFSRFNGSTHQVKIEVTPDFINMWDNNQVIINNYPLVNKYGNGFGPFASYLSHDCSSISYFSFKNIKMETKRAKKFKEVLLQPIWRSESDRYVVNVENNVVSDFDDQTTSGEILTRMINSGAAYIAIGSATNQSQANTFIAKNNGNGTFISGADYGQAMELLANYIYSNIKVNGNEQFMILGENNHLEVTPASLKNNTQTEDFPNGRWKIKHDFNYYENSLGQESWSNQWMKDLPEFFNKPGRYELWFGENHPKPQYIYVHRRPVADFALQVTKGANNFTITVNDRSYDPDLESTVSKGIAQTEWKWRETTATTWTNGMIPSSLPLGKDYLIQLRVLDEQGAWSQPATRYVSTGSTALKPIADFQIPDQVTKYKTLDIQDQSYDPAGRTITQRVWSIKKDGAEIYTGSTMVSNFLAHGVGDYTISLKVLNDANLWSDDFQRRIRVTEDLEAPIISFSPGEVTWTSQSIPVTISYTDDSSISKSYYKLTTSIATPSTWDSVQENTHTVNITTEGQWYIHAKAQDITGKESTVLAGPYQLQHSADIPVLKLNSIGENWSEIGWSLPSGSFGDGYQYEIENTVTGRSWSVDYPTDHVREEGLAAGSTYQYRIKAKNHVGESAWSEQFEVLTLPDAVGNLKVSFVPNQSSTVNISFYEVPSAESYLLSIKEGSKSVYEEELSVAGIHQVTGLEPGKQYKATVTAKNASGYGQSSILGFLSLPAAPGEFRSIQIRETEVELSWNASPTASLYELLRYAVGRYSGSDLSYTDTGLESGTEYDYQLAAKNESGFGDIAYLNGVFTLPCKTEIDVDEIGKDEVTLSIKNAVRGAENYVLLVNGMEDRELSAETRQFTVNSLEPGSRYIFEVYAENRSGAGMAGKVEVSTLPGKPQGLAISDIEENSAKLSWNPVPGADKYKVTVTDAVYFEISGTEIVLTNLNAGSLYHPEVIAGNVSGYGEAIKGAFLTLPAQPGNLHLAEIKSDQFTLAWDEVISANKYVIYNNNGEQIGETEKTSYTVSDLKPGETIKVFVAAENDTGEGKKSGFTQRTLPADFSVDPDDPNGQSVTIGDRGEHFVVINIKPVDGADWYKVIDGEGNVVGIVTAPETEKEIGGLESAKEYDDWTIIPVNDVGEGKATPVPSFVTLPSSSFEVSVIDSTQHTLTVKVESLLTNEIFVYASGGKELHRSKEKVFTARNLKEDQSYKFEVWMENSVGDKTEPKTAFGQTLRWPSSGGWGNGEIIPAQPDQPVEETLPSIGNETPDANGNGNKPGFSDIDKSFAKNEILALYERGIVKGVFESKFEPDREVTRVEFASMLVRALELEKASDVPLTFEDIQRTAWYVQELGTAVLNGIAHGFSDKEFRPQAPVTREQAAKMIANAAYKGNIPTVDINFKDANQIATWAKPEVAALTSEQVISGYPDKTFKPKLKLTRAECAALIYRSLHLFSNYSN